MNNKLTWVFLSDCGDKRASKDAPVMVSAASHGIYFSMPLWKQGDKYPLYGMSYVPNDSPTGDDGFANEEGRQSIALPIHYIDENEMLRDLAQLHHNKVTRGEIDPSYKATPDITIIYDVDDTAVEKKNV